MRRRDKRPLGTHESIQCQLGILKCVYQNRRYAHINRLQSFRITPRPEIRASRSLTWPKIPAPLIKPSGCRPRALLLIFILGGIHAWRFPLGVGCDDCCCRDTIISFFFFGAASAFEWRGERAGIIDMHLPHMLVGCQILSTAAAAATVSPTGYTQTLRTDSPTAPSL